MRSVGRRATNGTSAIHPIGMDWRGRSTRGSCRTWERIARRPFNRWRSRRTTAPGSPTKRSSPSIPSIRTTRPYVPSRSRMIRSATIRFVPGRRAGRFVPTTGRGNSAFSFRRAWVVSSWRRVFTVPLQARASRSDERRWTGWRGPGAPRSSRRASVASR